MKKLIIIIAVLAILTMAAAIFVNLTTNATITNDVAMNQLNGGDEAYIILQAYQQYKNIATTALCMLGTLTITFISIAFYNIIKIKNNKNTKGE